MARGEDHHRFGAGTHPAGNRIAAGQQEALLHLKEPEQLEPYFRAIEDLCAAGLKLAEKTILRDLSVQVYGVIAEISRQCLDFESRLTIEQVRQELSCRAKNNRTLAELAEKCGLSERSFERQFRKHCGCSFLQYLQGAKIGGACILLQNTLYSIDEIVRICNFRSKPYFYRTFKKQTGTTPMAFRDSHRKGKRTQLSSLISKNKSEKISSSRKKILWLIIQNPSITVSQIARNLSFSRSAVQKNLEWLKNNGFITHRGSRRNGYWYFQADQAENWNPSDFGKMKDEIPAAGR